MGEKMSNAPVFFTVTQVKFNPILNIAEYIPAIQDQMRKAGFPDFYAYDVNHLTVPMGTTAKVGQNVNPSFVREKYYLFGNTEKTTSFIFLPNSIALQTTDYDIFDTFLNDFIKGLTTIHKIISIDFVERIGLRYMDAILPKAGECVEDYLNEKVLGMHSALSRNLTYSLSETVTAAEENTLRSRVVIREGQIRLDQPLPDIRPRIAKRFTKQSGIHAVIDTDAFVEKRDQFSIERIKEILVVLHDEINNSFFATITEYAKNIWK